MLVGAHSIIYSRNPDADRAFLRDVLGLPNVDVGAGWLIFGLPPAEMAVHPSARNNVHELYLMCDDVEALVATMKTHGIACGAVKDQGWGLLTQVSLPGGGRLGMYQPKHARPRGMSLAEAAKNPAKRVLKKAPGKKAPGKKAATKKARSGRRAR